MRPTSNEALDVGEPRADYAAPSTMRLPKSVLSVLLWMGLVTAMPSWARTGSDAVRSPAALSNAIREAYRAELDREPDAEGMRTFHALMSEGADKDAAWLRGVLRESDEARGIRARKTRARLNTLYVGLALVAVMLVILAILKAPAVLGRRRGAEGLGAQPPGMTRRRVGRGVRWALINALVAVALILMLEGLASFAHVFNRPPEEPVSKGRVAERMHTAYDELLGWVNTPNTVISNMYGKGRHLRINAQGFRDDHDIGVEPPSNTLRVIASGDSFTMGYGVGNDAVWVRQLEDMLDGVECVNMGQGGYGLGQAYLWYKRDGAHLAHDVHILSFITDDYRRMTMDRFMGYGKPVLTVDDRHRLKVTHTPPPRHRLGEEPWRAFLTALTKLRLFGWLQPALERRNEALAEQWSAKARDTARALFADLHAMHREEGRIGVLVHLPWQDDYDGHASDAWRRWLREEARTNGWFFIDLVRPFRAWPREEIAELFIQEDTGRFRGARGHYTEKGNRAIARALLEELKKHPELAPLLDAEGQRPVASNR